MAQVIKITYESTLRRIAFQESNNSDGELSFAQLDSRIRELFQIPITAELKVTYTDKENDVVTMGNDQDLKDALVYQSINPLRLCVTLVKPNSTPGPRSPSSPKKSAAATDSADAKLNQLLKDLPASPELMKHLVHSCETLIKGVTSPAQIPGLLENVVQMITSQLTPGAQVGAPPATREPFETPEDPTHQTPKSSSIPIAATSGPSRSSGPAATPEKDGSPDSKNAVHHGVTCDICGVNPLMGSRWKSNIKYDYDLCSACFEKHGNEIEYTKIFQPGLRARQFHGPPRRLPHMGSSFTHMGPPFRGGQAFGMWGPFGDGRQQCSQWMGHGVNVGGKPDARFVCDVTMFDGTEVAPGTAFTKIWRLRNSGNLPWPAQTSLVHVGGDDLGQVPRVPLHISEQGLAPEAEIEVSLDLVAPEKPGRYVSHWRLASPSGPKFGHRFWVHIQVVPKETLDQPISDDALRQDPEAVADSTIQEATRHCEPAATSSSVEVSMSNDEDYPQAQDRTATEEGPGPAPAVDAKGKSIVDIEEEKPEKQVPNSSVEESVDAESSLEIAQPAVTVEAQPAATVEEDLSTAKTVLDKLEAMGFADAKLNAALLEKNNWDLRMTLDDLCAAEDWDPILAELEEMGFYDTETNRRLMIKNNGSVKHVVKELVQMSRGAKGNAVDA